MPDMMGIHKKFIYTSFASPFSYYLSLCHEACEAFIHLDVSRLFEDVEQNLNMMKTSFMLLGKGMEPSRNSNFYCQFFMMPIET